MTVPTASPTPVRIVAPSITAQPLSQWGITGATASFTVSATGTAPLTYQWHKGTTELPGKTASILTLSPLALADAGQYSVVVSNSAGRATSVSANLTVSAPPTAPPAPRITAVTRGDRQVSVAFATPASTGGSVITGYTVTSSPGGITATGLRSPLVATGLTNGVSYTFTITATNAIGTSPASAASASVVPATLPEAPVIGTAVAGNGFANVVFSAPASNGGAAVTSYVVTASPGGRAETGTASPITVNGLANGTAYTFTVAAVNAVGTGPSSSVSNTVTPAALGASTPGAPTMSAAVPADGKVTVSFVPPLSNGGSPITAYRVTSTPGSVTATGAASPITVLGLTNGTSYRFVVQAINAAGSGPASTESGAVVPVGAPGAPVIGTAGAGNGNATVAFTPPASNGGSAILSYTATSTPGSITATGATSPIFVTGLTNGVSYTFTVTATSAVGTSAASAASNAVRPAAAPTITTAPADRTVTEGDAVTLSVVATGTAPLAYQWTKDGIALVGQTASSLSFPAVTAADAALYAVTVSNSASPAATASARLTVNPPVAVAPSITAQPAARSVAVGATASYTVSVSGTPPMVVQWSLNGSTTVTRTIATSTGSDTYALTPSIQTPASSSVTARISNTTGFVISDAAALSVTAPVATVHLATPEELDAIRNYPGASYVLDNDIDVSTIDWIPPGTPATPFSGTLDGGGHQILGLLAYKIGYTGNFHYGFIGVLSGTIRNLTIADAEIASNGYTGGFAGEVRAGGLIFNSHFTGNVQGGWTTGGLAAYNYGTIENSSFGGTVRVARLKFADDTTATILPPSVEWLLMSGQIASLQGCGPQNPSPTGTPPAGSAVSTNTTSVTDTMSIVADAAPADFSTPYAQLFSSDAQCLLSLSATATSTNNCGGAGSLVGLPTCAAIASSISPLPIPLPTSEKARLGEIQAVSSLPSTAVYLGGLVGYSAATAWVKNSSASGTVYLGP